MKISELYSHPIKSAAAISVDAIRYNAMGPEYDRQWMAVDLNGKFLTQRALPKMCLIRASVTDGDLTLSGPNKSPLSVISADEETSPAAVTVWRDSVTARDCGDEAANWLSGFLGKPCRLVRVSKETKRPVDTDFAHDGETVGFADGFPTLIVSQASLDEFNSHLSAPVDMRRFRPNIVITGCEPYAEDTWQAIVINDIEFKLVKPCSRCIMPSINPDTGAKEMQVNQTLLETRRRDRQTYFGQNALHTGVGEIRVGDSVQLLR